MTIPRFETPYIFWRPSKVYGMHKMCITGGSFIPGEYLKGNRPPNYPMPAMIGEVYIGTDDVIICDCDESFDPRLCIEQWHGKVYSDYPHDSPNYR